MLQSHMTINIDKGTILKLFVYLYLQTKRVFDNAGIMHGALKLENE